MLGIFLIGNFALTSLTKISILLLSCPDNQLRSRGCTSSRTSVLACCVLVAPFRLLVYFRPAPCIFCHFGCSVCSRRSASATGHLPCVHLLQPVLLASFVVPGLALLCANQDRVRNLHCPHSPRLPTCWYTRGAWSCANWAFDRQVCTICVSLDSDLGADARRSGEDIVEILATYLDSYLHWQQNRRVYVAK